MYLFTDSKTALKEAVLRTSECVSAYELLVAGRRLDRASAFAAEFERTANDNHEALAKLAATVSNAGGLGPYGATDQGPAERNGKIKHAKP
jgi:hypothetical protein